jgi:urease accessory protein
LAATAIEAGSMTDPLLALLHLCDSLFPIGAFAYSDGLEAAANRRKPETADGARALLGEWMDVTLDETIGRLEGPAAWTAWRAFGDENWRVVAALDEELAALRPSSSARRSSRAMGRRLLVTWSALHPDPRLKHALTVVGDGRIGPALAIAFAGACACGGVAQHDAVAAFAYTRLAATVSAAMRLMPIGQTDAHAVLAGALERVSPVVGGIACRNGPPESFAPLMDIACMSQQYLHSRLFRS